MTLLAGKRIVVTGASRGIGAAIARACAREGARVGVNCLSSLAAAEALVAEDPERLRLLPFDVSDRAAVDRAVTEFVADEGGVDGWVNNAGINLPDLLVAAAPERIERQVQVNLLGAIHCSQRVLKEMMRARAGVLINLSSVAAARPSRGQAVYAATKGALESLTRALAVEYAKRGVRVHCLRPGPIETEMFAATKELAGEQVKARIPLGRFGTPDDVAAAAVHLLSERAAWTTGGVHTVDGGFLL